MTANRFAKFNIAADTPLEKGAETLEKLSAEMQSIPASLTDEEATSLLAVAAGTLDFYAQHKSIFDRAQSGTALISIAQTLFQRCYQKVAPDSLLRTQAFDHIMKRYDELVIINNRYVNYTYPVDALLDIDRLEPDDNQLRPEEIESAIDRVFAYIKRQPLDDDVTNGFVHLLFSSLLSEKRREEVVGHIMNNARTLESTNAYEAILAYEAAIRGTETGQKLNNEAFTALLTFADKIVSTDKKNAAGAYRIVVEHDDNKERVRSTQRKLSAIAPAVDREDGVGNQL